MRETDLRLNRNKKPPPLLEEHHHPKPVIKGRRKQATKSSTAPSALTPHNENLPKTYQELRLRGYTGTIYDAKLLLSQGENNAALADRFGTEEKPRVEPKRTKDKSSANLTVTVRSLRNTPSRLRARCERGRISSDTSSTSSGISDDASSSSSGSDRDSGIETSSSAAKTAMTFDEKQSLEKGMRQMNIQETPKPNLPPLKLTLRKKLSPVLDEVLASGTNLASETAHDGTGEPLSLRNGRRRRRHIQSYEVLRMEGVSDEEFQQKTKTKRLRLKLGDETLTSIDLNWKKASFKLREKKIRISPNRKPPKQLQLLQNMQFTTPPPLQIHL